jgi:PKD repeat protein
MRKGISKKAIIFGIIMLFVGASFLQQTNTTVKADLTDGLVGYWNFDEGSGNILHDSSGNGNDGTVHGNPVWTTGKFGNAINFDGIDDWVDCGNDASLSPLTAITLAAWYKPTISWSGGGPDPIIDKPINSNDWNELYQYHLSVCGDLYPGPIANHLGISLYIDIDGSYKLIKSPENMVSFNQWSFIVATYDGTTMKMYIDNELISSIPVSGTMTNYNQNLRIAKYKGGSEEIFLPGVIDEIRIYNRALTADEIHELYIPSTVYVDNDFDISTAGWGYDHFSSIQAGVDAVDVGGTVLVSSGTYSEPFSMTEESNIYVTKSINLIGENRETTIINGSGDYYCLFLPETVSGIHLTNFTLTGAQSCGIWSGSSNSVIDGIIAYGFVVDYGIYQKTTGDNCVVKNCYFHHNEWGFHDDGSDGLEIFNCTMSDNTEGGFRTDTSWKTTNAYIHHNNMMNNPINANDVCDGSNLWDYNYYDDYSGIDANGDGIGDTPYDIDGSAGEKDLHPYMQENGWLLPPNQPPVADAGGPYYANVGNSITFTGSGSTDTNGTIAGYRWDWTNDGTYDTNWITSATTTHSYPSVGTYTIKLEAKDNDGATDTDTATAYITTAGGAVPTAEVNGPYSGYVNHPVFFSSAGSIGGSEGTITEWYWTFGDGAVSSQQNPSHTYTSSGTFTVTLKVTNNFGQTNTDTTSATIADVSPDQILPVADAGGPYSGVVGSPITFNGSGSMDLDGTIMSYLWNFGDSTTGTGVSPTHTYTIPGNYTVILTVTDNDSLINSNSTTVSINVSGPPTITIAIASSNIEPIEEENEKTFSITVQCEHQPVRNIHLEILEQSNLTIISLPSNISLNPGESRELFITIKAPKLNHTNNSKQKVSDETIILRAVGDGNVTSNTEQVNFKVIGKDATPGFETVATITAIGTAGALVTFFRRRNRNR